MFALSPTLSAQSAGSYTANGLEKMRQGNIDGAIADYGEAIKLEPTFAAAYLNRGNAEFLQGNLDASIADFSKALELKPDYRVAYYMRGLAKGGQTNLSGGCDDLNKAIDAKAPHDSLSDYAALYSNLFAVRLGNTTDVRIEGTTGWSSPWTHTLATFLSKQVSEAELMRLAATIGGPDKALQQGEALYFAGCVKVGARNLPAARVDFQRSLEISSPTSPVHRLAQCALEQVHS
jgi:tetratricopeptide (TPR) repeat protein